MAKKTGHDRHSVVADPGFVKPEAGDFHLTNHKTVQKTGFVPFDYTRAGVYGSAAWKEKAILPDSLRAAFDKIMGNIR